MKKNKVISVLILFILFLSLLVINTNKTYANIDYEFEISIRESSTGASYLSTSDLIAQKNSSNRIGFDIYIKSIGQNRTINSIQAGWIQSNDKITFYNAQTNYLEFEMDGDEYKYFTSPSSSSHLAIGLNQDAVSNDILFYELEKDVEVRIAKVNFNVDASFASPENFDLSLDFVNYANTALEDTYNAIRYDKTKVKVNKFTTNPNEPDAGLKSLKVGSQNIEINNATKSYEANLSYDESKLSLNDLVKLQTSKVNTSYLISSTGEANNLQVGDQIKIDVTDLSVDPTLTESHYITIASIADANTKLLDLGFNSDNKFQLNKAFNKNEMLYTVEIPSLRQSHGFTIKPVTESPHATVEVFIDNILTEAESGKYSIVNLSKGLHELKVVVTNNSLTETYIVEINQKEDDKTATLSELYVVDQSNKKAIVSDQINTLLEETVSYTLEALFLENTIKSVSFILEIYKDGTSVRSISGNFLKDATTINRFKYSTLISINKGERHTITIDAVAEDGSTHHYTYDVERLKSSNVDLVSVSVNEEGNLYSVNNTNGEYHYILKNDNVQEITVNPVGKAEEYATIILKQNGSIINGGIIDVSRLQEGTYTYEIYVAAQNGTTSKSYVFTVTKLSNDVTFTLNITKYGQTEILYTLENFTLQGNNYVLSNIPFEQGLLSVEIIANHANAKVEKTSGVGVFGSKANRITGQISFTGTTMQLLAFTINVTGENSNVSQSYDISLTRNAAIITNTLSELTISGQDVNGFNPNIVPPQTLGKTTIDPLYVPATLFLDAVVTNNEATTEVKYEYKLSSDLNYLQGQSISYQRGKLYDVKVTVTSQAGTSNIYFFQFIVASTNNEINSIELFDEHNNPITLNYHKDTYEYTVNVLATVSKVKLVTSLKDTRATVSTGADTNGFISLDIAGKNTVINVFATSESQDAGQNYKITIVRGSYRKSAEIDTLEVKLSNGEVIQLNPVFQSNAYNYTLRIDEKYTHVDILAQVKLLGESFLGGNKVYNERINLNSGEQRTIQFIVIAEDGVTKNTYTLNILRANNDASLAHVIIDGVVYSVDQFTNRILNLGTIPFSKKEYEIEIVANDEFATVTSTLTDGKWMLLKNGNIEIQFTINAQDKTTKQTFKITVNRQAASNNVNLNPITLESNGINLLNGLTPTISNNTYTYKLNVNREVTLNSLVATKEDENATIRYAYDNLDLTPGGEKTFTIIVTAEDGITSRNYNIIVTQKNTDNAIESIEVNDKSISFDPAVLSYELGVFSYSERVINLSIILADETYAKVYVNNKVYNDHVLTLVQGGQITIQAESENGQKGKTYTLKYTLNSVNTDNNIDSLSISGLNTVIYFDEDINKNIEVVIPSDFIENILNIEAIVNKNLKQITQTTNITTKDVTSNKVIGEITLDVKADGSIHKIVSISVKAEDSNTKTFTITFTRGTQQSSNKEIVNISIHDLNDNLLKSYTSFNQMSLNVNYPIYGVKITVELLDTKATHDLTATHFLSVGVVNHIEFRVKAEDQSLSDKYLISIYREKADTNVNLNNISVINEDAQNLITNFDPLTRTYDIKLSKASLVEVTFEKAHVNQNVLGNIGEVTLSNGLNTLNIYVIAEDGVSKNTYQIRINVLSDENEITSITLNGETKDTNESLVYTFENVAYDISQISIDFETSLYATKFGHGTYQLNVGENTFKVYAVSESGIKGIEYTLKVTREAADTNNNISSITVTDLFNNKELVLDQAFNSNNLIYTITLDAKTNYQDIIVDALLESDLATITGIGTYRLKESNGIIFEIITLTVKAQNGDVKTYQIKLTKVNVSILNEAYEVEDIELFGSDNLNYFEGMFNKEQETYEIKLPYEVSSLQLNVLLPVGATLQNNNNQKVYYLVPGQLQQIRVQSIAQDGTINPLTYIIIVERQKASTYQNLDLLTVTELENGMIHTFENLTGNEYLVEISKETTTLEIFATTSQNAIIISGLETISANKLSHYIMVQAQDNNLNPKVYILNIKRIEETEVIVDSIEVLNNETLENIELSPSFNEDTFKYEINLTNMDVKSINITANILTSYTKVTGLGVKILPTSSSYNQTYIITFTSEDNLVVKTYEITIIKDLIITPNLNIEELSLIGNDGNNYLGYINALNIFKENIYTYEITVPYQVTSLNLFIKNNYGAKLNIPSLISLSQNYEVLNKIEFHIYLPSGEKTNTYTLNIKREAPSHNNYLTDILIDGVSINDFNKDIMTYELVLDYKDVTSITLDAFKEDQTAKLFGAGVKNLNHGLNVFHLTVTAEDGISRVYEIKINLLSFDHELYTLTIKDYEDKLIFEDTTYTYQITVDYLVSYIEIMTTQHAYAKVFGSGIKNLEIGSNFFEVYVQSEANTIGNTYEIEVIRLAPSNDASLSELKVYDTLGNEINFTQTFDKDTLSYIIYVEDESLMSVNIYAKAISEYANVYNTGVHSLEALVDGKYHHVLNIMVIAQDETSKTYSISFYRNIKLEQVTDIDSFGLIGSDLVTYLGTSVDALIKFDKNIFSYEIFVPHTTLSMNAVVNSKGNVFGGGQKLFNGNEEIIYSIYIESIDKSIKTEAYQIIVKKLPVSNVNTLEELIVNGSLIEGFDPNITNYEVVINNQNEPLIDIDAKALAGKVIGTGTYDLVNGKNYISINVTAENGDIKTYTVLVKYIDTNALLESLVVKYSSLGVYDNNEAKLYQNLNFDANVFEYTIYVEPSTRFINLSGAAQNLQGATVLGFGTYKITNKEEKIFIHVSSEDQATTEIYTVNVVKEILLSSNSQLQSLSIKNQDITFDSNTYQYKINLTSDISSIELNASTFDQNAKVSVVGYEIGTPSNKISLSIDDIIDGNNVILIKVEAEDGSIAYYRLNVDKDAAANFIATLLLITAIILWAITVTSYFIHKVKKNNNRREGLII